MNEQIVISEPTEAISISDTIEVIETGDSSIEIIEVAEQGPQGPPGADTDAALAGFTHDQSSPASTWTINHNLGRKPIITLLTTGFVEFEGQLTHMSDNQTIANFATAIAGTARCI
jgi:hypothetical protein